MTQKIYTYAGQKSWLDFVLGLTLCIIISGFFFLNTSLHRDVLYASLPLGIYFLRAQKPFSIKDLKKSNLLCLSAFFILLNFLSILWSQHNDAEMLWTTFKIAPFLTISILSYVAYMLRYNKSWDYFIDAYILCAIASGALLLILFYQNIWDSYIEPIPLREGVNPWRLEGFGRAKNANLAGLLYSVSILAILFKPTKVILYMNHIYFKFFGIFILGTTLFLTLSRGALIAFTASIIILCTIKALTHIKNKSSILFIPLILLVVFTGVIQLFPNIITYMIERGSSGRIEIWSLALEQFLQSPIIGQGSATRLTYNFFFEFSLTASHEHNIYLTVLTDLGIVGFLSFIALLATTWFYALHYARKSHDYSILGMITYGYIFGVFDLSGYYVSLAPAWIVFWLPIAFLASERIKENNKSELPNAAGVA